MIYKSYLVEKDFKLLKSNLILFYGENIGLIQEFKKKIIKIHEQDEIIKFTQEEILNNSEHILNEINNTSLFHDNKIFLIDNISDKIINLIELIFKRIKNNKIYLFSNLLEKKSKLRIFCEKDKKIDVVPCYEDNETSVKKLIINNLKMKVNVTPQIVALITNACGKDRVKLINEIDKINTYFSDDNKLNERDLIKLLNLEENNDFNLIRDSAISGDKTKTSTLLNVTFIELEQIVFYLSILNQRILKLKEIIRNKQDIDKTINELKPPIFWKDKPTVALQAKKWDEERLNKALQVTYSFELKIKSNSSADKLIIFKKLIVDICRLANAA